jgi:glucan phosphoethanolaminetransferase (alkaline phosphatase superfamily)
MKRYGMTATAYNGNEEEEGISGSFTSSFRIIFLLYFFAIKRIFMHNQLPTVIFCVCVCVCAIKELKIGVLRGIMCAQVLSIVTESE